MAPPWHAQLGTLRQLFKSYRDRLSQETNGVFCSVKRGWHAKVSHDPRKVGYKLDNINVDELVTQTFHTKQEAEVDALAKISTHELHKGQINTLPKEWQALVKARLAEIKKGENMESVAGACANEGNGWKLVRQGKGIRVVFNPPEGSGLRHKGKRVEKGDVLPNTKTNIAKVEAAYAGSKVVKRRVELAKDPQKASDVFPTLANPLDDATNSPPPVQKPAKRHRGPVPAALVFDAPPAASGGRAAARRASAQAPTRTSRKEPPKRPRAKSPGRPDAQQPRRPRGTAGGTTARTATPAPAPPAPAPRARAPPPPRRTAARPGGTPRNAAERYTDAVRGFEVVNWASVDPGVAQRFESFYRAHLDDKHCGSTAKTYAMMARSDELFERRSSVLGLSNLPKSVTPAHWQEFPGLNDETKDAMAWVLRKAREAQHAGDPRSLTELVNYFAFEVPDDQERIVGRALVEARCSRLFDDADFPRVRSLFRLHLLFGEIQVMPETIVLWPTLYTHMYDEMAHLEGWVRYVGAIRKNMAEDAVGHVTRVLNNKERVGIAPGPSLESDEDDN